MPIIVPRVEASLCRIVDRQTDGVYVGTVVFVSDAGDEGGYALTCWHNFDDRFRLAPFDENRRIANV